MSILAHLHVCMCARAHLHVNLFVYVSLCVNVCAYMRGALPCVDQSTFVSCAIVCPCWFFVALCLLYLLAYMYQPACACLSMGCGFCMLVGASVCVSQRKQGVLMKCLLDARKQPSFLERAMCKGK